MRRSAVLAAFLIAGALVLGITNSARSTPTLAVTVSSTSAAADVIDLGSMTYAEAVTAFDTALGTAEPSATLPVAPTPFTAVTADAAVIEYGDPADLVIAVHGQVSLLGRQATMIVTALWDDQADQDPDVAVLFRFESASLTDLNPGWTAFDVALPQAWIGMTRTAHTVPVDVLPSAAAALLDEDLDVGSGVSLRAVVDTPPGSVLDSALGTLGLEGPLRLDGLLATSVEVLDDPPVTTGLDVTASVSPASSTPLPHWIALTPPWQLRIAADTTGSYAASFAGGASLTLDGTQYPVTMEAGVEVTAGVATFSLAAALGRVENLFGRSWLDLDEVTLAGSIDTQGALTAAFGAQIDLSQLSGQHGASAAAGISFASPEPDTFSASVSFTTDVTLSARNLAQGLGASGVDQAFDVSVNGFELFAAFERSAGATSFTISATTQIALTLGDVTPTSDLLVRIESGSGQTDWMVGVRVGSGDMTLGGLIGHNLGDADIVLPDLAVLVSNRSLTAPRAVLDPPTVTFFDPVLCSTTGCDFTLEVAQGVSVVASVKMPPGLLDAMREVGLDTDEGLLLTGTIPLFGGTQLGVSIAFPEITAGGEGAGTFRGGKLELFVALDTSSVEIGLRGHVVLAVPRANADGCSSDSTNLECLDLLTFGVEATLSVGTGVSVQLIGSLQAQDGWVEPFGISGLTVYNVTLLVGVSAGGGGPVGVDLGFRASLLLGTAPNQIDLTVSFLLAVTPNPPFLQPKGFTAATTRGFGLFDLVHLYEMISGETVPSVHMPPNLRVQDVHIAIGLVDEPALCIRQGFFLTGELHVGGTPPADATPACLPPPVDPPEVTQKCADSDSCLASILIDINTGSGGGIPSLKAAGFIAQTSIGPLHFDPTILEIELSAARQRLYVKGGARLDDPLSLTDPPLEWGRGSFELDFEPTRLYFDAEVRMALNNYHAKATGNGKLDLDDPEFEVEVWVGGHYLGKVGTEISKGINKLRKGANDLYKAITTPENQPSTRLRRWRDALGPHEPDGFTPLFNAVITMENTLQNLNEQFQKHGVHVQVFPVDLIDAGLHGYKPPNFPGVPAPMSPSRICVIWWFGSCIEWVDVTPVCLGINTAGGCWYVPPFVTPHIPGTCGNTLPASHKLCQADDLFDEVLVPQSAPVLEDDTGVDVPDDADSEELKTIVQRLDSKLQGNTVEVTCGVATMNYGAGGGTISPVSLTVNALGNPVDVEANIQLNVEDPDVSEANQQIFEVVAELGEGGTPCDGTPPPPPPDLTLEATPASVNEGGQVTASGTVDGVGAGVPVFLDWGDGTSTTVHTDAQGAFSGQHVYRDDTEPGDVTTMALRATVGAASTLTQVAVHNVAPTVQLSGDAEVDEGSPYTLHIEVIDPGLDDTHTVEIDWGNGTTETLDLSSSQRNVTATHTWVDDLPKGEPRGPVEVGVVVTDKDGGQGQASHALDVVNVAPHSITLEAVEVLDGVDGGGPLEVYEGQIVLWEVRFVDPGLNDTVTVHIDWQDGQTDTVVVPPSTTAERSFLIVHRFADDDPSGTPFDPYDIVVRATDDDTGLGEATVRVIVHNVDPTIDLDTSSTAGATTTRTGQTFLVRAEHDLTLHASSYDPGADDLVFRWDHGDGTSTHHEVLWADVVENDDPFTRHDSATHAYGDACLYEVTVHVVDDDTGASPEASVPVAVQGSDVAKPRNDGWWGNQVRQTRRDRGDYTMRQLACRLAVAGHLSQRYASFATFSPDIAGRAPQLLRDADEIFSAKPNGPRSQGELVQLDQALLAAWLSYAEGAWEWTDLVDTDGDGIVDTPFHEVMAYAEEIRATSSDADAISEARRTLWRLGS